MNFDEETFIPDAINHLAAQQPGTKEYDNALKAYNTLITIEKTIKELEGPSRLQSVLTNAPLHGLVGNVAVSLLMLNFERLDIITSSVRSMIRSK